MKTKKPPPKGRKPHKASPQAESLQPENDDLHLISDALWELTDFN